MVDRWKHGRPRSVHIIYLLLFVYIAISLSYQLVGSVSLITGYFDLRRQVTEPFQVDSRRNVTVLADAAKRAGLTVGDKLESLNGVPYTGRAQLQSTRWYAHPGEVWRLGVRKPDGTVATVAVPLKGYALNLRLGESVFIVFLYIIVPLFCLIIGYWVALARPADPNAWLILVLLTYPEGFISVSTYNWWPGLWFVLRLAWHIILLVITPAALLWLGLLFPERSRIDARLSWLKWIILAVQVCGIVIGLIIDYAVWYNHSFWPDYAAIEVISDRTLNWFTILCLLLYWVAIFGKLRSASTPDTRRRLRVLCLGSAVGLGSALIIWGALPALGFDPAKIHWLAYTSAALLLVFPLTLAYVVIVQRAMDVRILVRMGTRYALARTTLAILQLALAAFLLLRFVVPALTRPRHGAIDLVLPLIALAVLFRLLVARRSLSDRLQQWLDRKFFREAYDAEVILSELAIRARRITDPATLIDTICRRIAEVLHVEQVAALVRSAGVFRLQQAVGFDVSAPIVLPESSLPVQHLVRTNSPAVLHRGRLEGWLLSSGNSEKHALEQMRAEVLLPLHGREKLMGVIVLGPKRSEEPYSPSDLRMLASVGAQTGLGLEVGDLAQSLAEEASQRQRIQREIEIAREVQEHLFPQRVPAIAGVDLAGHCRPAQGVGGDYYDFIELDGGRLALAIGDVSGKGISAALLMASLRASLRGLIDVGTTDLAHMMRRLNRLVYESSTANRYATFFFAVYDPDTRELRYVNAGHNSPVIVRGESQPIRLDACGPVVGLLSAVSYTEESLNLAPGDVFLGYTDGISEAMTMDEEEWGEERMLAATAASRELPADKILQSVFNSADSFTSGALQHDDMTLVVMRIASLLCG